MFDARLAAAAHGHVHQYEVVADLFAARYDAVTTVGEVFGGSDLGLGVAEACDGEVVSVDGATWRVPADGTPVPAPADLGLPFAIAAAGGVPLEIPCAGGAAMADVALLVTDALRQARADDPHHVAAVRIDGTFRDVLLRSERRQEPPYQPLVKVLADEVHFAFDQWAGTLVGFRFPDVEDGLVIPGLHLHAIAADRRSGGHVHRFIAEVVTLRVWVDDAEITVPHDRLASLLTRRITDDRAGEP